LGRDEAIDEAVRRIARSFSERELLKIGNRSYENAFRYPESRFDSNDPVVHVLRDPSGVFTDYAIIPPSYLVFKHGDRYYAKCGMPEKAGLIEFSGGDASEVMQSAVDSVYTAGGGRVFLRSGTYSLSHGLTVREKTELIGEGKEKTLVEFLHTGSPCIEFEAEQYHGDILLSDMTILANPDNTYPIISANSVVHSRIENVNLRPTSKYYAGDGIYLEGASWGPYDFEMRNCRVFWCRKGISITGAWYQVYLNRCYLAENTEDGVEVTTTGSDIHFLFCQFINNGTHGLEISVTDKKCISTVIGCTATDNDKDNFHFVRSGTGFLYVHMSGIRSRVAGSYGVYLYHAWAVITDLWEEGAGTAGVRLEYYADAYIILSYVSSISRDSTSTIHLDRCNFRSHNSGVAVFSGDGSTTEFKIEHGLVSAPSKYGVTPLTPDAHADKTISADDTYITITFSTAPPSGTDNLKFSWWAEV